MSAEAELQRLINEAETGSRIPTDAWPHILNTIAQIKTDGGNKFGARLAVHYLLECIRRPSRINYHGDACDCDGTGLVRQDDGRERPCQAHEPTKYRLWRAGHLGCERRDCPDCATLIAGGTVEEQFLPSVDRPAQLPLGAGQ